MSFESRGSSPLRSREACSSSTIDASKSFGSVPPWIRRRPRRRWPRSRLPAIRVVGRACALHSFASGRGATARSRSRRGFHEVVPTRQEHPQVDREAEPSEGLQHTPNDSPCRAAFPDTRFIAARTPDPHKRRPDRRSTSGWVEDHHSMQWVCRRRAASASRRTCPSSARPSTNA